MENFLRRLYFERFKITERERELMAATKGIQEDSEQGRIHRNRQDQSITEVRRYGSVIDDLIKAYIEELKQTP